MLWVVFRRPNGIPCVARNAANGIVAVMVPLSRPRSFYTWRFLSWRFDVVFGWRCFAIHFVLSLTFFDWRCSLSRPVPRSRSKQNSRDSFGWHFCLDRSATRKARIRKRALESAIRKARIARRMLWYANRDTRHGCRMLLDARFFVFTAAQFL